MANPLLRPSMQLYPEDAGNSMKQLWHGLKWVQDCPDDLLTPTAKVGDEIYYVDELLLRHNGQYFIPKRFFMKATQGQPQLPPQLWALGHEVVYVGVSSFVCLFIKPACLYFCYY